MWLYTHTPTPKAPAAMLQDTAPAHTNTAEADEAEEPIGPALYDTALTAEEGLWHRSGWAGRT